LTASLYKFIHWQLCLQISEGNSRPPENRQATPAEVATLLLSTAALFGLMVLVSCWPSLHRGWRGSGT